MRRREGDLAEHGGVLLGVVLGIFHLQVALVLFLLAGALARLLPVLPRLRLLTLLLLLLLFFLVGIGELANVAV